MKFSEKHMEVFGLKNKKLLLLLALALVSVFTIVGCGNSAPANKKAETKAEPAKGLVEQWKDTGHSKFFAYWVSQGVDGAAKAHYGDKCINCHSAVTKIDDPNAKFADFLQGGKYAGKTEGVSCRVCHKLGGEDGIQLNTPGWDSCANCHTGGTPTLGSEVHHPQGEMIKGVAIKGSDLPAMPSFKYANMKDDFACYSCHVTNGSKHDFLVIGDNVKHDKDGITRISATLDYNKFKETFTTGKTLSGKSCNTCHSDSSSVINKIKTTQANTSKRLEELKKIL